MGRLALFELTKHDQRRKIFSISSNKDYTILVQQVLFEKYWNTIWSYNLQQQLINLNGNYKSNLFHIPRKMIDMYGNYCHNKMLAFYSKSFAF